MTVVPMFGIIVPNGVCTDFTNVVKLRAIVVLPPDEEF
jgi:hypothetical protein